MPCDRQPAEATATFHLTGPGSPRCQTSPCAQLTLSPDHGPPGTEIQVSGWAPLNEIIGDTPFAYNLIVEAPDPSPNAPYELSTVQQDLDGTIHGTARVPSGVGSDGLLTPGKHTLALETLIPAGASGAVPTPSAEIAMTLLNNGASGSLRVILAPTTFSVSPAPTWASLGSVHPIWIQPSVSMYPSGAIAGDPANPKRLAYCAANGIQVSDDGGQRWTTISTAGIARATTGSPYELFRQSDALPRCLNLALDPVHPRSFYATFGLIRTEYQSAPPIFAIGFSTNDAGQSWRLIPPPNALDLATFGGFQVTGRAVLALFSRPSENPMPSPAVEVTSDGGKTWMDGRLSCPAAGPCVRWGAASLIVTGMGAMLPQSIERSIDNGRTWSPPPWPSSIATRSGSSQLVALGPTTVALVGTGIAFPQYPLLLSTDSGATWKVVAMPALPHSTDDPLSFPGLMMLPNGELLAWENAAPGSSSQWYLLQSGSTTWCRVNSTDLPDAVFGTALQIIGGRLWWVQEDGSTDSPQDTIKSVAIATLRCRA
jgi:hypothetical protein